MGDDIEARLAAAAEALREHELAGARKDELRRRAASLEQQIAGLRKKLRDEQADVRRLEGPSLTRLIVALRGDREDALARERAEAEAAGYRVAEAEARLAAIAREERAEGARLTSLTGAHAAYAAVLDEKEGLLAGGDDARGPRLLELADERGRLTGELKELGEAHRAAGSATQALGHLTSRLGSAENWSTYDTFFGGGMIASAIKHSRLDEAADAAAAADRSLALLRTELADVDGATVTAPRLEITELTRFVDIFLDNIFTDFSVLNRIEQAQQRVAECARLVSTVESAVVRRGRAVRTRLAELDRERRQLLTG
jgi:hypothetical protein